MINYFSEKYPNEQNLFSNITPIIFTNKWIKENKLNKMKVELSQYKNNNGKIFGSFNNYEESLKAREEFIKKHNAFYVAHGGKDILTGYGAIAFEIDKQIPKNKKISFYAAIGAGGPIGIGLCLSYLRDVKINIVQTKGFDAFIRSLNNNTIEYNDRNINKILVSDGIAVDKPELFSLEIAKKLVNEKIVVREEDVYNFKDNNLGNSSKIALFGLLSNISDNADYKIILDCEGN